MDKYDFIVINLEELKKAKKNNPTGTKILYMPDNQEGEKLYEIVKINGRKSLKEINSYNDDMTMLSGGRRRKTNRRRKSHTRRNKSRKNRKSHRRK